jgi:hypothetical protein
LEKSWQSIKGRVDSGNGFRHRNFAERPDLITIFPLFFSINLSY